MHGEKATDKAFVKVYRYRIQPDRIEEYLAIQHRADQVYRKHVRYRIAHLQSRDDPAVRLEIHWYPDEETHRRGMELIDAEPEISHLWGQFQAILDPADRTILEEHWEQVRFADDLSND